MNLMRKLVGTTEAAAPNIESAADTIERLCDRLQNASLIEDRIGAVRSLKSLSKTYRLEVGTQAMHLLVDILQNERDNIELLGLALESLLSLFQTQSETEVHEHKHAHGHGHADDSHGNSSSDNSNDDQDNAQRRKKKKHSRRHGRKKQHTVSVSSDDSQSNADELIGIQFAEMFASKSENVRALVDMFDEFELTVRLNGVRVLNALVRAAPRLVQDAILAFAAGVTHVLDLLSDARDVVRYEAVIALRALIANNSAIQKIVAFDNGFESVLDAIATEQYSDGGVVVHDCIELLLGLLRNNVHNQNFFAESGFIERLVPFFELRSPDHDHDHDHDHSHHDHDHDHDHCHGEWSAQKRDNVLAMLAVVRTFVVYGNATKATRAAQASFERAGLLRVLCDLLVGDGVPRDVLIECVLTVADSVRGAASSQQLFASLAIHPEGGTIQRPQVTGWWISGSSDNRSLLVVLLMSMVSRDQPFSLRLAAVSAFSSVLYRNSTLQHSVLDELLPRSGASNVPQLTIGALLFSGIPNEPSGSAASQQQAAGVTGWLCCIALSNVIADDANAKERLLRVQIASNSENSTVAVSFFSQCCAVLADQRTTLPKRLGLLQLLATWLCESAPATAAFLRERDAVQFCVAQTSVADATADQRETVIRAACAFLLGMCLLFNDDSVPEYGSRQLRTVLERRIGVEIYLSKLAALSKCDLFVRANQQPEIVARRESELCLDYHFTTLFKLHESRLQAALLGNASVNGARAGAGHAEATSSSGAAQNQLEQTIQSQSEELERLRAELAMARTDLQTSRSRVDELQSSLTEARRAASSNATSASNVNVEELQREKEQLAFEKRQLEEQLRSYAYYYTQSQYTVQQLQTELEQYKSQQTDKQQNGDHPASASKSDADEVAKLRETVARLEKEKEALNDDVARQQQDLDDLLVLLADQELKLETYVTKFGEIGQDAADADGDVESSAPSPVLRVDAEVEKQSDRIEPIRNSDHEINRYDRLDTRLSESPLESRSGAFSLLDFRGDDHSVDARDSNAEALVTGRLSLTHENEAETNSRSYSNAGEALSGPDRSASQPEPAAVQPAYSGYTHYDVNYGYGYSSDYNSAQQQYPAYQTNYANSYYYQPPPVPNANGSVDANSAQFPQAYNSYNQNNVYYAQPNAQYSPESEISYR